MIGTPIASTLAEFGIKNDLIKEVGITINSEEDTCICGSKIFREKPIKVFHFPPLICCSKCNTILNFNKPYGFDVSPVRYQDLSKGVFPQLILSFSDFVTRNPSWNKIREVSNDLYHSLFENFNWIPSMLKHYTSINGGHSIINSSELWAFNISEMNDPTEIQHAQTMINAIYDEEKNNLSNDVQEIFRRAIDIISDPRERSKYFIICFTSNHDSKIHWESYASNDTGISIGVSSNYLGLDQYSQIRRVIYQDVIKKELIKKVIYGISELYEELPKSSDGWDFATNLASFAALANHHLIEFLFTFKDDKYTDEEEFRLVIMDDYRSKLNVQRHGDRTFVKVKLAQTSSDMPMLPIVGVFFGKNTSLVDKISICNDLLENGYDHVTIAESINSEVR